MRPISEAKKKGQDPVQSSPRKASLPFTAEGLAIFYNMIHGSQNPPLTVPPHLVDPMRALMDQRIRKLMLILGPGAGKSKLTSVVFPAFMIGMDPTITILGISAGESLMTGFMNSVGDWIDNSPYWASIFPHVVPDRNKGWSSERGLFVTGHAPGDPDANYFACGLTSSALTGKHAKILNCDDVHNKENSATSDACDKVKSDYYKTILGRQDPQGARMIFTGRRWNNDDVYGHLIEQGEYVVMTLPAIREKSPDLYWDISVPDGLVCCFTDGSATNVERVRS